MYIVDETASVMDQTVPGRRGRRNCSGTSSRGRRESSSNNRGVGRGLLPHGHQWALAAILIHPTSHLWNRNQCIVGLAFWRPTLSLSCLSYPALDLCLAASHKYQSISQTKRYSDVGTWSSCSVHISHHCLYRIHGRSSSQRSTWRFRRGACLFVPCFCRHRSSCMYVMELWRAVDL